MGTRKNLEEGDTMGAIEYYSYDDYIQWKGDWELIYGYPIAMSPSPMITHQMVANLIAVELTNALFECEECMVVWEQDWKISDETVVRPDVVVICNEPNEAYITKTPKVVVEVVSKSSAKRDETTKFELYEKEKVPYYIIVYPNDLKAKIYRLEDKNFSKVGDFSKEVAYLDEADQCKTKIDFERVFRRLRK